MRSEVMMWTAIMALGVFAVSCGRSNEEVGAVFRENLIRLAAVDFLTFARGPWGHDFMAPSGLPGPYRHSSISRIPGG